MNSPTLPNNPSALVIGAGISGLTAAYALQNNNINTDILEESHFPGGVLQSFQQDGFLAESGANSLRIQSQKDLDFLHQLNLQDQIIHAQTNGRFIYHKGKLFPQNNSLWSFLSSPLLSWKAKFRLLKEPFIPKSSTPESIAQFISRRFGKEISDKFLDPFVSGIYATSPNQLSAQYAFPKLYNFEQSYGSVLKGFLFSPHTPNKIKPQIISFRSGMHSLPLAILKKLISLPIYNSKILHIKQLPDASWSVRFKSNDSLYEKIYHYLILAIPAYKLDQLPFLNEPIKLKLESLSDIPYSAVSALILGFHRHHVRHPLNAFGFLIPSKEKEKILGSLFSSSIFPNRAPSDHVTITTFLGGPHNPQLALANQSTATAIVLEALNRILGLAAPPCWSHYASWPKAIPTYALNYAYYHQILSSLQKSYPTLALLGNYHSGVGIPQSLQSALNVHQSLNLNFYSTHQSVTLST